MTQTLTNWHTHVRQYNIFTLPVRNAFLLLPWQNLISDLLPLVRCHIYMQYFGSNNTPYVLTISYHHFRGCASRSPEASETQLGQVEAICDLARLASGIIVVISVFNSLLNNVFCLCTAWHAHTVFSYVYGTTRIRCLTHKLQQCLQTRTNTQQTKELKN